MFEPQELFRLLDRVAGVRVLVVGDAMVDHYVIGAAARLSPEAPVPVVRFVREEYRPGGAANTALNVRALGAKAELVAVAGEDPDGALLRKRLTAAGVVTGRMLTAPGRGTTHKTRILAQGQQLLRVDREDAGDIAEEAQDEFIARFAGGLKKADAVILSDYGKGAVTAKVAAAVISQTLAWGKLVCVDPKEDHFALYRGATSLTPNHHEAAAAAGIREKDDPELEQTGRKLLELLAPRSVLITCGERGMVLFGADGAVNRIPTRAREVFDVAGAGDTVIATFTAALAAGATDLDAAHLANFAAGVVVAKVGTATATPREIKDAITDFRPPASP